MRSRQSSHFSEHPTRNRSSYSSCSPSALTVSQVGRLVKKNFKLGDIVKGMQLINEGDKKVKYFPYQRRVLEYQNRQSVKKMPVKKKVIEFKEHHYIQQVPREVIETGFTPVLRKYYPSTSRDRSTGSLTKPQFKSIDKQCEEEKQKTSRLRSPTTINCISKKNFIGAEEEYDLRIPKQAQPRQQKDYKKNLRKYGSTSPSTSRSSFSHLPGKVNFTFQSSDSFYKTS